MGSRVIRMQKTSDIIWQDKQHAILFELIDQIRSDSGDLTIFARLADYAENHFVLEEEYMQRLNYPDAEAHIAAHDKFRRELAEMVAFAHEYDAAVNESLSLFLTEWLRRHVLGIDKQFEAFVLKSPLK